MRLYFSFLVLLISLLVCTLGRAQEVIPVEPSFEMVNLTGKYSYAWHNEGSALDIKKVSEDYKTLPFSPIQDPNLFSSEGEYWVHFRLKLSNAQRLVLVCMVLTEADIYYKKQGDEKFSTEKLTFQEYRAERYNNRSVWAQLPLSLESGNYDFYIRSNTINTLKLFDAQFFDEDEVPILLVIYSFLLGAVALILFYNFFLLLATRDRIYAFYLLYLFLNAEAAFTYVNVLVVVDFMYDYSQNPSMLLVHSFAATFSTSLFAERFLNSTGTLSKFWLRSFRVIEILMLLFTLSIAFIKIEVGIQLTTLIIPLVLLWILIAGIASWRKKNIAARFFVVAFLSYFTFVFLFVLVAKGVIPNNNITGCFLIFGITGEALLLSFALADRINSMKRAQLIAQEQTLSLKEKNEQILREQNRTLENKVKERTQAIQQKQEEILTQNEELQQQQEEINAINEQLEVQVSEVQERNQAINDSIRYARTIQEALLPHIPRLKESFQDSFVLYKPQHIVSGDFFWFRSFDDYKLLAVGDCTGHGVPGAFMSLLGMSFLDYILTQHRTPAPAQMLEQMNRMVISNLRQKRTGNQDGMELIICRIEPDKIIFSASKRSLFIVEKGQELQEYKGTRRYIGNAKANAQKKSFEEHIIKRTPDMMLYLSSDGFQDQLNDDRKRFGSRAFKALLEDIAHRPSFEQKEQLKTTFYKHKQNVQQIDDVTVLGVRLKRE